MLHKHNCTWKQKLSLEYAQFCSKVSPKDFGVQQLQKSSFCEKRLCFCRALVICLLSRQCICIDTWVIIKALLMFVQLQIGGNLNGYPRCLEGVGFPGLELFMYLTGFWDLLWVDGGVALFVHPVTRLILEELILSSALDFSSSNLT